MVGVRTGEVGQDLRTARALRTPSPREAGRSTMREAHCFHPPAAPSERSCAPHLRTAQQSQPLRAESNLGQTEGEMERASQG
eukprot:6963669-Pyramimonas_sp.AAC.1